MDSLWRYVLFSENTCRTLPECAICGTHGAFVYEGLGGIKKVGNGKMYIPITEKAIYIIPDILFHYFFSHNAEPTELFRYAVINSCKPDTNQYKELIKESYYLNRKWSMRGTSIICSHCGSMFEGSIAYKLSKNKGSVKVYKDTFVDKIRNGEKYVGVCIKCLHYSKV